MSDTVTVIREPVEVVQVVGESSDVAHVVNEVVEVVLAAEQGPAGPQGIQGIQGEPGSTTGADAHYTHTQSVAEATWTITHGLNKYPSITIVDSANDMVVGDVEYTGPNTITVFFSGAFGGKAYLN